nr:hypothetical protein [Micromonospora sp. DSM 115978]
MYAWIWSKLPFGLPGKLVGSLLLTTAALALLWYVVFPWAEPLLPFDDVQVTQDSEGPSAPADDPGGQQPGGEGSEPAPEDHDLPYDTERNDAPPPSPSR